MSQKRPYCIGYDWYNLEIGHEEVLKKLRLDFVPGVLIDEKDAGLVDNLRGWWQYGPQEHIRFDAETLTLAIKYAKKVNYWISQNAGDPLKGLQGSINGKDPLTILSKYHQIVVEQAVVLKKTRRCLPLPVIGDVRESLETAGFRATR